MRKIEKATIKTNVSYVEHKRRKIRISVKVKGNIMEARVKGR